LYMAHEKAKSEDGEGPVTRFLRRGQATHEELRKTNAVRAEALARKAEETLELHSLKRPEVRPIICPESLNIASPFNNAPGSRRDMSYLQKIHR
jgi:hypothetical protein